jgi:type I restriction enzyme S subunit
MSPEVGLVESDGGAAAEAWNLPNGWTWARLSRVAEITSGQSPPSDTYNDQKAGLPFFQGKAEFGSLSPTTRKWCTRPSKIAEAGDVLISVRAPVGPTNIAAERCGIGRGLAAIRASAATSAMWLLYYLRFAEHRIAERGTGTTFAAITAPVLAAEEIPLAPLPEQRRIVARIDELFAEIAEGETALECAREGLDTWRRALLKAAVTGELTRDWREATRPAETGAQLLARIRAELGILASGSRKLPGLATPEGVDSKSLPELPESWAWVPFGEIIESLRNGTATVPVKRQTDCPILRISAVRPMAVDASDIRYLDGDLAKGLGEFQTQSGDFLFTRYNGSRRLVGVCGIFLGEEPVYYPDKIIRVRLAPQLHEISPFLEAAINSGATRKFIDREIKTTAGQHGISGTSLRRAPIPIPPLVEAKRITELLSDDLSRAEDMEVMQADGLKSAADLRQSILKAAFEGRLVPQDPADEPASVMLARLHHGNPQTVARRRPARAKEPFSHPSLSGLTRQSLDPQVEPAGDD